MTKKPKGGSRDKNKEARDSGKIKNPKPSNNKQTLGQRLSEANERRSEQLARLATPTDTLLKTRNERFLLNTKEIGDVLNITADLHKIAQIQIRPVFELLNSNYFQNNLVQVQESTRLMINVANSYQSTFDQLRSGIQEIVQAQIEFRERFQNMVSESLKPYLDLQEYTREWTRSILSVNAEILGFKFDFQYTRKSYKERKQVVVEIDKGANENGLEVYQTFEKDGQKYTLVAIPESNYEKFTHAYTGSILENENVKLSISAQTTTILESKSQPKVKYDTRESILSVGNYERIISKYSFVHRSLEIMTQNKANKKVVWYYSELLELQEPESEKVLKTKIGDNKTIKKCYESFLHIKRGLPDEINDLFTVKSKYVSINEKYI